MTPFAVTSAQLEAGFPGILGEAGGLATRAMELSHEVLAELQTLAAEGGWVFGALILLAFGIAFALLSLWHAMHFPDPPVLSSREWLRVLRHPRENPDLLERLRRECPDDDDPARRLREIGERLFSVPERRFPFAFVMIGAAPLVGLLGTVSGMFSTFRGMATATSGAPIDVISDGISEALITTQTGLVIGVPTLIVCGCLKGRHDELVVNFHRVESRLLQADPH